MVWIEKELEEFVRITLRDFGEDINRLQIKMDKFEAVVKAMQKHLSETDYKKEEKEEQKNG